MFDIKPCLDWNCINSFAPWLSAIGTIVISGISLWLALKDKLIRIDGNFRLGIISSDPKTKKMLDRQVFILNFVNIGTRKVKINYFRLIIKNGFFKKKHLIIFPLDDESLKWINPQFPIVLGEMENTNVFFDINFFLNLKDKEKLFSENSLLAWFQIHSAYFLLETSVGKKIKLKIYKDAKQKLIQQFTKNALIPFINIFTRSKAQ